MSRVSCITAALLTSLLIAPVAKSSVQSKKVRKMIALTRQIDVSQLDSSLPGQRLDAWLKSVTGPQVTLTWEANDCGEQTGGDRQPNRDFPQCAGIQGHLLDGRAVAIEIAVGTLRKGIWGPPVFYSGYIKDSDEINLEKLGDLPKAILHRRLRLQPPGGSVSP